MITTHAVSDPSLHFDLIVPSLVVANKKQAMQVIAGQIAGMIGISERILAEKMAGIEKENPLTLGDGAAAAHLHISSLKNPLSAFIRFRHALSMDAPDGRDVDLFYLLLTPAREGTSYLRTLARMSRLLRNPQIRGSLRAAANEKMIRDVLGQSSLILMAA